MSNRDAGETGTDNGPHLVAKDGESAKLSAVPLELAAANDFVREYHRHSKPTVGHRFSIGALCRERLVGAAIVGRPIARNLQDGFTAEVLRLTAVPDSPRGTCSFLYASAWRAWRAMGGRRLVTYTLQSESGASLRGAGWNVVHQIAASDGWLNRPWRANQAVYTRDKFRWEMTLPLGESSVATDPSVPRTARGTIEE